MRRNGSSDDEPLARKRGRPAGKNRVPLTAEERRARNTQYERERRNDKAKAMAELAEAAGCTSNISTPDLLNTVINQIQNASNRKSIDNIDNLRKINENLMSQINKLEDQLKLHRSNFERDSSDVNHASDSDQQSMESYKIPKRNTRPRTKKSATKRKRKNRSEESDSQDSMDVPEADDDDNYKPKRFKSEREIQHANQELQRKTRSSSSQSSYESQALNHRMDNVHSLYKTEAYQSNATHQTSHPVPHMETSTAAITPPSDEFIRRVPSGLPAMSGFENWPADYVTQTIQQPEPEYTPEFDYRSLLNIQEPVPLLSNEAPSELLPLDNLNFLEDGETQFINDQSDWFDSLFLNSNVLENGGSHLVYS